MTREEMIAVIESEINRLEQVRELLRKTASGRFTTEGIVPPTTEKKKRVLSPDARKRIAQAQKRRWAKQRNQGSGEAE